jgi:hypothetical protein
MGQREASVGDFYWHDWQRHSDAQNQLSGQYEAYVEFQVIVLSSVVMK